MVERSYDHIFTYLEIPTQPISKLKKRKNVKLIYHILYRFISDHNTQHALKLMILMFLYKMCTEYRIKD